MAVSDDLPRRPQSLPVPATAQPRLVSPEAFPRPPWTLRAFPEGCITCVADRLSSVAHAVPGCRPGLDRENRVRLGRRGPHSSALGVPLGPREAVFCGFTVVPGARVGRGRQ